MTPAELDLLRAALTIPTCWKPSLRDEALQMVERAAEESAPAEAATSSAVAGRSAGARVSGAEISNRAVAALARLRDAVKEEG